MLLMCRPVCYNDNNRVCLEGYMYVRQEESYGKQGKCKYI